MLVASDPREFEVMNTPRPILSGLLLGLASVASSSATVDDVRLADAAFADRAAEVGYHLAFVEYLADDAVLFRPEAVQALVAEHLGRRHDHGRPLWALLNFMMWHEAYIG